MKKILMAVLVVLTGILSFLGGTYSSRLNTGDDENLNPYQTQVGYLLGSLVVQEQEDLISSTEKAGEVLGSDRSFILSYFVDKDYSNRSIVDAASHYGTLLGVSGFEIVADSNSVISTYGDCPDSTVEISDAFTIVSSTANELWYCATAEAENSVSVRSWIRIDTTWMASLSEVMGSELLLMDGASLLMSTLPEVNQINLVSEECMVVDSEEMPIISLSLNDSLILISLTHEERL